MDGITNTSDHAHFMETTSISEDAKHVETSR